MAAGSSDPRRLAGAVHEALGGELGAGHALQEAYPAEVRHGERLVIVGPGMMTTAMTAALESDVAGLLEGYEDGTWHPATEERALAEGLARARWSPDSFRASLRAVSPAIRAGRLVDVLDPAAAVLESAGTPGADSALLALRRLVDALAAESCVSVVMRCEFLCESGAQQHPRAGAYRVQRDCTVTGVTPELEATVDD
ncbi:hypothetical protein [Streptomyces jeddahensis]|uniref:Uncharacterized protein n=1 Tax=Streptomyces jeddahensis TaxID=1716141 RepID=A0A177HL48_9ACTN|nr:hypothetical protein [Streptomyces jeddahensis]OAH11310.1 hypothetical protein STSP_52580 [Streptomyces jeddahensis]